MSTVLPWRDHLEEIAGWHEPPITPGLRLAKQRNGLVFPHPQNFENEHTYGTAFARWVRKNQDALLGGTPSERNFASRPDVQLHSVGVSLHRIWHRQKEDMANLRLVD